METYLALRPFITTCRFGSEAELQNYAEKHGPMLLSEAVSSAWLTNTNKEIFHWIAKHVKNSGSNMDSEFVVWATIVQLCQHVQPTAKQQEQIAFFICNSSKSNETLWKTVCYPRLPCFDTLLILTKLCKQTEQTWMWLWQAAWNAGDVETAKWALRESKIKLSSLPTHLRTICIFRKPIEYELVEKVPLAALKSLIEIIIADDHIKTICVETAGGYRNIRLQWELRGKCGRTTRHRTTTKDNLVPLRFHKECLDAYETPAASFKLLWLGLAPSYLEHLEKVLEIIDSFGAMLVNITGHCDEKSSEDKNILIRTLRCYAENKLCASRHRTNMFNDACL